MVIAVSSVVIKEILDYAVVGGNPAWIMKYRNKEKIDELLSEDLGYIKCTKYYT